MVPVRIGTEPRIIEKATISVTMPIICDRCQDEKKEAFFYGAIHEGKTWRDLCNECFDYLFPDGEYKDMIEDDEIPF